MWHSDFMASVLCQTLISHSLVLPLYLFSSLVFTKSLPFCVSCDLTILRSHPISQSRSFSWFTCSPQQQPNICRGWHWSLCLIVQAEWNGKCPNPRWPSAVLEKETLHKNKTEWNHNDRFLKNSDICNQSFHLRSRVMALHLDTQSSQQFLYQLLTGTL